MDTGRNKDEQADIPGPLGKLRPVFSIAELRDLDSTLQIELRSALRQLLYDEGIMAVALTVAEQQWLYRLIDHLEALTINKEQLTNREHIAFSEWLAGALRYILFFRLIESGDRATSSILGPDHANEMISFLRVEFDLPASLFSTPIYITFHRRGTTSYVFKVFHHKSNQILALKLLKFPYFSNLRIVEANKRYAKAYGPTYAYAPIIHAAGEHFVLMDFVTGSTLREFVDSAPYHNADRRTILRESLWILLQLCDALQELESEKAAATSHLDLSPDNILIEPSETVPFGPVSLAFAEMFPETPPPLFKVKLIDFGINYLISERIGAARDLGSVAAYIDPAVVEDGYGGPYADGYSIGVITELLLLKRNVTLGKILLNIDVLWDNYPYLTDIIEDLVAVHIDVRKQLWAKPNAKQRTSFERLSQRYAFAVAVDDYVRPPATGKAMIVVVWECLSPFIAAAGFVRRAWRTARIFGTLGHRRDRRVAYKLLTYAAVCNLCFLFIMFLCFMFIFRSPYTSWLGGSVFGITHDAFDGVTSIVLRGLDFLGFTSLSKYAVTSFSAGLPAAIIVMSSALVAWRYYTNVFASLYAKEAGPEGAMAETLSRLNSWFFFLPSLVALLAYQRLWPFMLGVCVLSISGQNFACWRLVKKSAEAQRIYFREEYVESQQTFSRGLGSWWWSSAIYGVSCIIGGWAILSGYIADELAYALVAGIGVNFGVMFVKKSGSDGVLLRSGLVRAIGRLNKIRSYSQLSHLEPLASDTLTHDTLADRTQ